MSSAGKGERSVAKSSLSKRSDFDGDVLPATQRSSDGPESTGLKWSCPWLLPEESLRSPSNVKRSAGGASESELYGTLQPKLQASPNGWLQASDFPEQPGAVSGSVQAMRMQEEKVVLRSTEVAVSQPKTQLQ